LALGFLATKARSDVLEISPPAELVPGLVDALGHLGGGDAAVLAAELQAGGAVSARRELLREMTRVAIDEAGERIARAGSALLRGEGSAAGLREPLAQLARLLDLYERIES
jgi:hypothetical protein